MKKATLALALVTIIGSFAHAGDPIMGENFGEGLVLGMTTMSPTFTAYAPTATTKGEYKKVIMQGREDIAYFVASEGAIRTVKFNLAMDAARALTGDQQSQDMELAQAVLADLQ